MSPALRLPTGPRGRRAPRARPDAWARRIPALPTLTTGMLLPTLESAPAPGFPFERLAGRGEGHAALYYLARNGVYHGLRALGLREGDTVLMPAYHHGVEVEAVRAAGARVAYYRVDRALRADLDEVRDLARKRSARVLYLTHFIGWPQALSDAASIAREQGMWLVEDCALALYSRDEAGRPLGQHGDLAIFCLYKTLPVPHGGLALSPRPLPAGASPPLFSTLHHIAGSLRAGARLRGGRADLLTAARALAHRTVDRVVDHEHTGTQHLRTAQLGLGASRLLGLLLRRFDGESIARRRRRNFGLLLDALGDQALVPAPLPPGACPLFFPLLVGDKARALAELSARGVEAIDFWGEADPACDADGFPEVTWLRRHVLEVPIHQDLDDEHMAELASVARTVLTRAGRAA